jgi:chemotaxis protein methyltransferase CheR
MPGFRRGGGVSTERAVDVEVERIEVGLMLEAIHAKYGYDLRGYTPAPMLTRVRALLARTGVAHLGELQHRLLHDAEFFGAVLHGLTVQVSAMFRDPSFYRKLRERVVPILRTYPEIKIWHAGCSSGEEVYAMAILLTEENLYDRTRIYATDISAAALERAREGVYPASRIEAFASDYAASGGPRRLDEYYDCDRGSIVMKQSLRRNLAFFQHDLVSDYALGEMNVILCRNVLIYFGAELRGRVFGTFAQGLGRGGFLCLGASEALPESQAHEFRDFESLERVYRRRS